MADDANKTEAAKPEAKAKTRKVRILLDQDGYKPNQVVTLPVELVEIGERDGWCDSNPVAVAWAEENEPQPEAGA